MLARTYLARGTGGVPPHEAPEKAAAIMRGYIKRNDAGPLTWNELAEIAAHMKVKNISFFAMSQTMAIVHVDGDGFNIIITEDLPSVEDMFSLAHELAHLFLRQAGLQFSWSRYSEEARAEEETVADEIAAALLLPARTVVRALPLSLEPERTLRRLSEQYSLPPWHVLQRLVMCCPTEFPFAFLWNVQWEDSAMVCERRVAHGVELASEPVYAHRGNKNDHVFRFVPEIDWGWCEDELMVNPNVPRVRYRILGRRGYRWEKGWVSDPQVFTLYQRIS